MSKIMNNEEKINKIKRERKQLLEMVKETILNNKDNLTIEINKLFTMLDTDEKNVKKYEALIKTKSLIEDLIDEIVNAKSVDDIINIRKRLNYYINKIKKELVNRNIDAKVIDEYQYKVSDIRKNIAKYVRFLKRNDNLNKIDSLYNDNQNNDLLKELIKKENKYNKTYLSKNNELKEEKALPINTQSNQNSSNNSDNVNIENNDNKDSEIEETLKEIKELLGNSPETINYNKNEANKILAEFENKAEKDDIDLIIAEAKQLLVGYPDQEYVADLNIDSIIAETKDNHRGELIEDSELNVKVPDREYEYTDDLDYLIKKIKFYKYRYGIHRTPEYDGKRIKDFTLLLKSIPKYLSNKERIKKMKIDSNLFNNSSEFIGYIAYQTRRNSIKTALKIIFDKSYMHSFEGEYLNKHEKCVQWILDYCENQDLYLTNSRRIRTL